jgi:hypothetical protein
MLRVVHIAYVIIQIALNVTDTIISDLVPG